MKRNEIKKLSIEERIVESRLFYFDDGYLGSTGHGACYYDDNVDGINDIKDENDLMNLILDEEYGGDIFDEDEDGDVVNNWNDYFDKWFGDCDEFEIIEDSINGGNGYGKIIVNKEERFINIMVVPCLYSEYSSNKESDIKIFGFDFDNGELIREIDEDKLNEILKDKDYYIG
jgi:predicted nucleic-acid-binding Zn-ribbon protein